MKKVLSLLFVLALIVTMFSACQQDEVGLETYAWKLDSVVSLKENGKIIVVGEQLEDYPDAKVIDGILSAVSGRLEFVDRETNNFYVGAYEEMTATDSTDDYKIYIDEQEGTINVKRTSSPDGNEEITLILTCSGYDAYFSPVY